VKKFLKLETKIDLAFKDFETYHHPERDLRFSSKNPLRFIPSIYFIVMDTCIFIFFWKNREDHKPYFSYKLNKISYSHQRFNPFSLRRPKLQHVFSTFSRHRPQGSPLFITVRRGRVIMLHRDFKPSPSFG